MSLCQRGVLKGSEGNSWKVLRVLPEIDLHGEPIISLGLKAALIGAGVLAITKEKNEMQRHSVIILAVIACLATVCFSQTQKPEKPLKAPEVTGDWTGTWGLYSPPVPEKEGEAKPKPALPGIHFQMTCKVKLLSEGKYEASFEGNAGRPYKFVIKMPGRQVGTVAMFSGTVDLGPMDGGVYDWIGRATDKEFIGFFTSQGYTGSFRMTRPQ